MTVWRSAPRTGSRWVPSDPQSSQCCKHSRCIRLLVPDGMNGGLTEQHQGSESDSERTRKRGRRCEGSRALRFGLLVSSLEKQRPAAGAARVAIRHSGPACKGKNQNQKHHKNYRSAFQTHTCNCGSSAPEAGGSHVRILTWAT